MFEHSEQASSISEGVVEIRINIQPCKGNNLTTQHTWFTKTPRVTTVQDDYQSGARSYLTPVHVFHVIPRLASVGGPHTILVYIL
jgi:hypothetical protein